MSETKQVQKKREYIFFDVCALIAGILLLIYLLFCANRSMGYPDEAFYLSIPQRFLQGDRFLVHEWGVEQLASLFLIIPYKLYVSITGGTEGIILAFRYFFVVIDICFYFYLYFKLRSEKFFAIIIAIVFCGCLPATGLVLNYYTISLMAIMQVCLILFFGNNKNRVQYVFIGIIWAIGILGEPLLIFTYILYVAIFLLKKSFQRKQKELFVSETVQRLFDRKTFLFVSIGGWSVFFLFIIFLYVTGSLSQLSQTIPFLVSDDGYSSSDILNLSKITSSVLKVYGKPNLVFMYFCVLGSIAYHFSFSRKEKQKSKNRFYVKYALFGISCFLLVLIYVHGTLYTLKYVPKTGLDAFNFIRVYAFHEYPILFLSLIWYLLTDRKDPRVWMLWLVGFLYSVCVDISSDWLLGMGGRISFAAGILALRDLFEELRAEFRTNKQRPINTRVRKSFVRGTFSVAVLGVAMFTFWNLGYLYTEGFFPMEENVFGEADAKLTETISIGPNKGLKTTPYIKETYEASLRDLDKIKQSGIKAPVLIFDVYPAAYLYLDLPYATTTAYFATEEKRLDAYWTMFPEKTPGYVYIPYFHAWVAYRAYSDEELQEELAFFNGRNYTVQRGEAGYLLTKNALQE